MSPINVGSPEELIAIIAAAYAGGRAVYEGVVALIKWFKKGKKR